MREKELRLALVCYGGISLAVYMHGITKEIWRLARASCAYTAGDPPRDGTERVYRALFDEIAAASDTRLRVLVDIVAGASAGGINGVFLAQAITSGQSLEPLTDLWLELADIEALLDPDQAPSSRFTKLWALPIAWMAAGRGAQLDETVEAGAREEVRAKLERFVRSRWFEPPFGGKRFSQMMLDALDAMAASETGPRLLPEGQPLDLFVTVTDFRGHPERLRLNSPPEVVETEHRLIVPFSDHGRSDGNLADPAELVFAARATSSFPGAFPPFMVGELDAVLAERDRDWPGRAAFLKRVLPRQAAVNAVEKAVLIDGSVLANAPFTPAIEALRERPARRQIDRRFIYVDPVPGMKFDLGTGTPGDKPTFLQTLIGALSELPRQQPIRDNLEAIAERSERIYRMRAIIRNIRPEVEAQIEALFGYTLFLDWPTPARLAAWRTRAQNSAAVKAGYGYAAYGHLKANGVIELLAEILASIGGDTAQPARQRLRRLVGEAAAALGIDDRAFRRGANPRAVQFLRRFDLGFRIRRLRFLARRLTEIEAEQPDAELAPLRDAIYDSLAEYLECKRTDRYDELRDEVRDLRAAAGPILERLAETMDLLALDAATDERLATALGPLPRELRRTVLLAYLGFAYFDVATLPLLQGEGLDEFDPIRVDRIAPDDATTLRAGGAEATLKGIQFNFFGAFFSRAYRENDYLWGRLHGAERLIDIMLSTLPRSVRLKPGRVAAIKRQAFLAILDEERERLTAVRGLIDTLREEVGGG